MVFSSTIFLFLFLPLVLALYLLVGRTWRNLLLLLASLFFYAWGENIYLLVMLVSIGLNYLFGRLIDRAQQQEQQGRGPLIAAVVANLGILGFFKYANFAVDNLNHGLVLLQLPPIELSPVHLPIGISFFTFQAMSYVIDLYRREATVQHNPLNLGLYIALFPQLIAGPIVRYHDIFQQISKRRTTLGDFSYGIRRFIIGLGKKVLIANILGRAADYLFSLPPDRVPIGLAWLGAIAFTLQIYYDFSGYSDMAIGLGRMFGFRFLENFNYPYSSLSIREFWRRWHISLSTWFRDYLYIPLGGNRKGSLATSRNLLLVFFLCGLWHGASWTFVAWGLYHGCFLSLERIPAMRMRLDRLPVLLRSLYVCLVVIVGWVFFRADNLGHALHYLQAMVDVTTPTFFNSQIFLALNSEFSWALVVGVLGSVPLSRYVQWLPLSQERFHQSLLGRLAPVLHFLFLGFVLVYSIATLLGGAHNPFLYFRF